METDNPDYVHIPASNTSRKSVTGQLENIGPDGSLSGWAISHEGAYPVRIMAFCDERLIGVDTAERPRKDSDSEYSNGFRVPLPADLFDDQIHNFEVFAESRSGEPVLLGVLARRLTRSTAASPTTPGGNEKTSAPSAVSGYVDGLVGSFVRGWAVSGDPHERLTIRAYEAGKLLAVDIADRPRTDVLEAGFGDGHNGFYLMLPREVLIKQSAPIEIYAGSKSDDGRLLGVVQGTGNDETLEHKSPVMRSGAETNSELSASKVPYLEESLVAAMSRIAEVERSERELIAERDALRARLSTVSELMTRELDLYSRTASHQQIFGRASKILHSASLTTRRDFWLSELSALGLTGSIYGMFPHDGLAGDLSILVCGSGGMGDALYLSTVVRELYLRFRPCRVFVLHDNASAEEVFANNPYVSGVIHLRDEARERFVQVANSVDIFDLLAEVRYAVTYTMPPLSRIDQAFFKTAAFRSAEWQRYIGYGWPRLNNAFANRVMAKGMTKLDVVGVTSQLPISGSAALDFFVTHSGSLPVALEGVKYVTLHHGSDHRMAGEAGRQTKNLPTATWNVIAALLKRAGFTTVQLGTAAEASILGVDIDLRGKLSLNQAAELLKGAAVHLDTEGGLVHLARAMHTRSVVAFGPTPVGFFGYDGNENVAAPVCGNCWWTSPSWSLQCPRDLADPECMAAHSAEDLVSRAVAIISEPHQYEIRALSNSSRHPGDGSVVDWALAAIGGAREKNGALLLGPDCVLAQAMPTDAADILLFADINVYSNAGRELGGSYCVMPFTSAYIPCNSGSLEWVCAIGVPTSVDALAGLFAELTRCVKPQGKMTVAVDERKFFAILRELEGSCLSLRGAPGLHDSFAIAPQLDRLARSKGTANRPLLIELVQKSRGHVGSDSVLKSVKGKGEVGAEHAARN